jgi:hypothetical protein
LVALFTGQAYGIWYAFLLTGVLFMVICMGAIFYIRRVGHQLEQRRLQSEAIRRS